MEVAGFWRRFGSFFIDGIVVSIPAWVLAIVSVGRWTELVSLAVSISYFTYFHGSTGQTPGDAALGIRVVDVRDDSGEPIGYARAATRWAVSIVSGIVLLLGYFWMLWDEDRQTWHDKAAGSVPVRV